MFSISFRKHRDEKKENNLLTLIIRMWIIFARAITTSTAHSSSVSPSCYTNTIFGQSVCVLSQDCFLTRFIIWIGPYARSDWSRKSVFYCFARVKSANEESKAVYYTVIKHSGHLRTLEKCRKHASPAARAFYIFLVFSNARRVLSQCNTRLRLLYLLNINRSRRFI